MKSPVCTYTTGLSLLVSLAAGVLPCTGAIAPPSAAATSGAAKRAAAAAVRELMKGLDSDSFKERQSALAKLRQDHNITLAAIEEVLSELTRDKSLTPEQGLRLHSAAFERFVASPRAAMGVQFSFQDVSNEGVEINAPIEGFDSAKVLQAGDIIKEIDGRLIFNQSDMRAAIVSYAPGDLVTLKLTREGMPLTAHLKMGSYDDLRTRENMGAGNFGGGRADLDPATLSEAWQLRCERLRPTAAEGVRVVESGLTDAQWLMSDGAKPQQRAAQQQRNNMIFQGNAMRQGNAWRIMNAGEMAVDQSPEFARNKEEESRKGGMNRDRFFHDQPVFIAGIRIAELQMRSIEITNRLNVIRTQLRWYSQQMQVPDLPPDDRRAIEQMASNMKREISSLEDEQQSIEAQINGR